MNIFENIPSTIKEEVFETLASSSTCKIERIVSNGHCSAEDFFYDQESNEWVIVLKGEAIIGFEEADEVHLKAGDYLNIPLHVKHQVKWTLPQSETICLAIHY